ncbi:MAG: amidase, partial [Cryomorphaceae bacterium]
LFQKYDFLALPSAQVFAFDAEIHWPKTINDREMDTYHRWMEVVIGGTLSGCPTINVPVGFDAKGRAMGMQLIAPMGDDSKLLDFAAAYEAQTSFLQQRPTLET